MERHFLFQVQEFHWCSRMAVLFPNAWFGRYQTFLCTGRNYGTSTYSVVYLVCISDRRLLSLAILILCGGFSQRIQYLVKYMKTYIRTGERKAYYRNGTAWENIHFTVPVFMSVMLYAGGMY